jgi:peptide/nickel transport system substrate-binding protein
MYIVKRKKRKPGEHVYVPELKNMYQQGRITRREFMRNACLLGMSFAAASLFVTSCGGDEEEGETGGAAAGEVKRGGTMTFGSRVRGIDHPGRYSWISGDSNNTNFVLEYLTFTDRNNVSQPFLLESWEASDDLLTWTLNLRQNVKWSTGEPFNADDVIFTMKEWLNPDVGSSVASLFSNLQPSNIEKRDDFTVVLYLDSPSIMVPENLYHYPAPILDHRTFEGDWLENPVGTGPFTLEEWTVGERAVFKAREEGYWKNGADGNPLPYLDEVIVVHIEDETALVNALKGGDIDFYYPTITGFQALKDDPNINIQSITTAQTRVMRMRVDMEPWTDNRVRKAVKLCQDKEKIVQLAYFNQGVAGADCHVSPAHPEYYAMEPTAYDPEQAKALLAEAGYPDGLDATITFSSNSSEDTSYAETLKQDAEAAGLRIDINAVPESTYWDNWTEYDFAITSWTHRPLAVMVLPLAYTCDAEGNPVPWNESRWCDEEFDTLLTQAVGTLDIEERREIMKQIQEIQVERGSIGIPYWKDVWVAHNPKLQNVLPHPTNYTTKLVECWFDTDA